MNDLEQFKKDFKSWSGFELEATNPQDIYAEITQRQWDLENEINQQAKSLKNQLDRLFPDY